MVPRNVLELARQGNSEAIAILLNRSLEPQGITATIERKERCLYVFLASAQIPARQNLALFIREKLLSIGAESIQTAKIYGRQLEQDIPAWQQDINLAIQPTTSLLLKGAIAVLFLALSSLFGWLFWSCLPTSPKSILASPNPTINPELSLEPVASFSDNRLDFDAQKVGTSSPLKTIILTNRGLGTLKIKDVSLTGVNADEFQTSNRCTSLPIAVKGDCAINIIFTPKVAKEREALLTITNNAADSPQNIWLSGIGTPPRPITMTQPTLIPQPTRIAKSTPITKPKPLVTKSTPIAEPTMPITEPTTPITEPTTPMTEPTTPVTESTPITEPTTPATRPILSTQPTP